MPFYKKRGETFKNGKLDVFVFFVVLIVFIWAFFFGSFKPATDENGNITYYIEPDGHMRTLPTANMQIFIAPIIMVYEMVVLVILPGKKRGRYLPWWLWSCLLEYKIKMKWKDGKEQTKEFLNRKR